MSGASTPGTPAASPPGDPSMEDILASIRRILSDDEAKPEDGHAAAPPASAPQADEDDALVLDSTMMVRDAPAGAPEPEAVPELEAVPEPKPLPEPVRAPPPPPLATLVAPEAAAAAASSVDNLVRTLTTERSMMVTSLGPTIEDIVRQEIRPLLKSWLDEYLPPLVERLVRTEIERVVGRART
jgi:cell pole-organizing protein PopZ